MTPESVNQVTTILWIFALVSCIVTFMLGYGLGTVANKKRLERFEKIWKDIKQARDDMALIKKVIYKMLKKFDEKNKQKT